VQRYQGIGAGLAAQAGERPLCVSAGQDSAYGYLALGKLLPWLRLIEEIKTTRAILRASPSALPPPFALVPILVESGTTAARGGMSGD